MHRIEEARNVSYDCWVRLRRFGFAWKSKKMPPVQILVVDDHRVVRRAICQLLSSDPILNVVCETADGEQAVQKAEELQPDLVLLDISLPGISGIEAARRIIDERPIPIVILTAFSEADLVSRAVDAGVNRRRPSQFFNSGCH